MCGCFNAGECEVRTGPSIPRECPRGLGRTERQIERDASVFLVLAKHPGSAFRAGSIAKMAEGKSIHHQNFRIGDLGSKVKYCVDSLRWLECAGLARREAGSRSNRWGLAAGALGGLI